MRAIDARHLGDPFDLVFLNVYGTVGALQERGDAIDALAPHRTTDVIGVVVSCKHTNHSHRVALDDVEERIHVVGRINEHAFTRLAVTDCIHEIHHLASQVVVCRKVATRQQLTKVEAVVTHDDEPSRAYS